jgi:predicted acylesterase/phospholipase RssA
MAMGGLIYLKENGILSEVKEYIGTSGGSVCIALFLAGMDVTQEFVTQKSYMDFDLNNVFSRFGVVKGDMVFSALEQIMCSHTGLNEYFTFKDFHELTGVVFRVVAYNVRLAENHFFDVNATPNMSVIDAVRMSCSIPFLFQVCKWNGDIYIDGGVSEYTQLSHIPEEQRGETLVIKTGGDYRRKKECNPSTFMEYISCVYNAIHPCYRDHLLSVFPLKVILSDTITQDDNVNPIQVVADRELMKKYYMAGYSQTQETLAISTAPLP